MAFIYVGSTKYAAVTQWAANTVYAAGTLVRQLATPATGSERVFACIVAGTSGGSEPTWTTTQGAKTTDNTATWIEVTGKAGVNGDLANTPPFPTSSSVSLGTIIKKSDNGSLQVCTTAGSTGASEPSFSNTAGTTTASNTATFTSLGAPGNFGAYAAPHARLHPILALGVSSFAAAGDTVYVSHNHAETQASAINYTSNNSTAASPLTIQCVNDTAAPPTTLATTATVSTTGANALNLAYFGYTYGITFSAGTGSSAANLTTVSSGAGTPNFHSCGLTLGTTSASSAIYLSGFNGGVTGTRGLYRNCTVTFGATGQKVSVAGGILYQGGSMAASGTVPTNLLNVTSASAPVIIQDCDLSAVTTTLVTSPTNGSTADILFANCKLGTGVAATGTIGDTNGAVVRLHNCDSGATNYRYYFGRYEGSVVHETSIVRSGGASDGTTPLSWNMTSNTRAKFITPFVSEEIAIWNDTSGSSKTATIEITTDATLTNADCWLEIEYPGSSASPLGSYANGRMAWFGTPAALTSSSATWGGTAKANKYKLQVPFTPQAKGPIKAKLYLAKASTTIYVDPLLVIT